MTEKLEFFLSTIFNHTFSIGKRAETDDQVLVADLCLREAAQWLLIGTHIDYFRANDAVELMSSLPIVDAFRDLYARNLISREMSPYELIAFEDGSPVVNKVFLEYRWDIPRGWSALLDRTFETFLLLTRENTLSEDAIYFAESIGWTDDQEWQARKRAMSRRAGGVQEIVRGFSKVLSYWEEMRSVTTFARLRIGELQKRLRIDVDPMVTTQNKGTEHEVHQTALFLGRSHTLTRYRWRLTEAEIVDRYFILAGECAAMGQMETPESLDGRRQMFDKVVSLVEFAGGKTAGEGRRSNLWSLFNRSANKGFQTEASYETGSELPGQSPEEYA